MTQSETVKKHHRMLHQGMLITFPIVLLQSNFAVITYFDFPFAKWTFVLTASLYFSINPFVYLMCNSQLRGDVLHMLPKAVQKVLSAKIHPIATAQGLNHNLNVASIMVHPMQPKHVAATHF